MKVQFIDFSLEHRPNQEFHSAEDLISFLRQLKAEEPAAGELVGENGFKLTLGIDGDLAFVQFSSTDGEPPYLVAQAHQPVSQSHDFIVTGQPTEVDGRSCLSFDEFEKIVIEFASTGQKNPAFRWEDA